MKKKIFTLAFVLTAGTFMTGCQSQDEKSMAAQSNVEEAKSDLKEAKKEANAAAQSAASEEEWKTFRTESEEKIHANEVRIAELKVKLKKPGQLLDPMYEKRIDVLQARNAELKAKMNNYEKNHSDWETFKREFNHDMDELGQSLKDFTVNNKK